MADDLEYLRNFQGVTIKKRYGFFKEKSFGLMIYWNNWNFPLELTFVFPFFSFWIGFGKARNQY